MIGQKSNGLASSRFAPKKEVNSKEFLAQIVASHSKNQSPKAQMETDRSLSKGVMRPKLSEAEPSGNTSKEIVNKRRGRPYHVMFEPKATQPLGVPEASVRRPNSNLHFLNPGLKDHILGRGNGGTDGAEK
ncbi:hypothetical protein K3495_g12613 [Podosphaera aphanis]|nr:hypothetical protein K3495_g12613 [Podosphaera aphanis]